MEFEMVLNQGNQGENTNKVLTEKKESREECKQREHGELLGELRSNKTIRGKLCFI
jgi:hypothetical protein